MHNFETTYWWYVALHELILAKIDKKKQKILDAGCGTGRLLELLSKHQTEGFDFSEEALEFCKSKGLNNIWLQDINTWQSEPKYDVIISADVICSTGIEDYKSIIKNFYKALNQNGILILNLPAFEALHRNHDKAVFVGKRFTRKELKKDLLNAGFKIDFITYRLPFLFIIIWFEKIFQKLSKNNNAKSDLNKLPNFINCFFLLINRIENLLFRLNIRKLFGSSVFCVAQKKN
ncbi:MAG: class I SAM-dependent methyltransferase [Bacteroidales bacterium]|nr:class I SAM-dependent methyltransferase [Bacteroidales bacterium]